MRFSLFSKGYGTHLPLALVALISALVATVVFGAPTIYAASSTSNKILLANCQSEAGEEYEILKEKHPFQ